MITDVVVLADEARKIHDLFQNLFYGIVTSLLCIGLALEYFRWPLGEMPSFPTLVGRTLVAALLLHAYPEITNAIAAFADSVAKQLGDLNNFKLIADRMGDKLGELTWSWTSVKDMTILVISFLSFFLLYFSIHIAESFYIYTWTLLFVFSPLVISLFVFPRTSGATSALFRSIAEVACWKIVWSVIATLLWSTALTEINNPDSQISFLTAIGLNIILAASLLLTPFIVHAMAGVGLAQMTRDVGSLAIGSYTVGPRQVSQWSRGAVQSTYQKGKKYLEKDRYSDLPKQLRPKRSPKSQGG